MNLGLSPRHILIPVKDILILSVGQFMQINTKREISLVSYISMPVLDRRMRQLLEVVRPILTIITSPPPPCNDTDLYAVLSHVIVILSSLPTPPPTQMLPFMQRVDEQFTGHAFRGVDLFKAGFPLANMFARSDFFPLSLSFRLKPSGTN